MSSSILEGSGTQPSPDNLSNTTDCHTLYQDKEFLILAIIRAAVGLVSFLACLMVVLIIVAFKKYRFYVQRLVLYLTIAAMIHSLSYCTARINYYTPRPIMDPYCYFGGFFNHYTGAVELIAIWFIFLTLFVQALFKKSTQKLEIVFVVVIFLGPALFYWIPLWLGAYGTAGGWCELRIYNEDCSHFQIGGYINFGIWYVPLYLSLIIILIGFIVLAIKAIRDVYVWGKYDPIEKQTKKLIRLEILTLIWYPLIYLLLNSFSLISQIYQAANPDNPSIVLEYLRVISSPLRGAVIALVYSLDRDTRQRLRPSSLRGLCRNCCKKDRVKEYDTVANGITDSYHAFDDLKKLEVNQDLSWSEQ